MTGMPLAPLLPWNDRAGRFSKLRAFAFTAALLPGAWVVAALMAGRFDAEPFEQATHLTGTWTLYFLLASLALSPLRRIIASPRLIGIRRLLGLTAFGYAAAHLTLFVLDQNGDAVRVVTEIASRIYLTIGFVALVGLAVLAATSFDVAIRRLGRRWRQLHAFVYPIAALGLLHFFMQSKIDVSEPVLLAGVFVALMLHRVMGGVIKSAGAVVGTLVIAVLAGLAAAGIEVAWYASMSGVPALRVFLSNFDFGYEIRPMWLVMAIAALPVPVLMAKGLLQRLRVGRSASAAA